MMTMLQTGSGLEAGPVGAALWSARLETPLGWMVAVANELGLVQLDFEDGEKAGDKLERLAARHGLPGRPTAIAPGEHRHLSAMAAELAEYFAGRRREFSVPLDAHGTAFQQRAWGFLRGIPYAETRSYRDQARALEQPTALRAVARANSQNPIAIVVPCHRVIGANGTLTGYAGGLARKQWLLDHERKVAGYAGFSEGLFGRADR